MVLQAASDWALRRLLKVVLKKNLKHMLATELDVEQLRVSLGTGVLELTDVLLSPEWLVEQAVRWGCGGTAHEGALVGGGCGRGFAISTAPAWLMIASSSNCLPPQPPGLEFASAFVGRLALSVAVTSLTCSLQLEDVLLVVRSSSGSASQQVTPLAPAAQPVDLPDAAAAGMEGGASRVGGPGIDDGVRLVAAGVETLLQRLSVTVTRLTVRVEGRQAAASEDSSDAAVATLSCAQVLYGAAPSAPEPEHAPQLEHSSCTAAATARRLAFSGLSLAVQQEGPPLLAPLSGEAEVTVTWPLDGMPGHAPHVSVAASLEAVQLQLHPPDVVALLSLARAYATASAQARLLLEQQQAGVMAAVGRPAAAVQQQQRQTAVRQQLVTPAGHTSFLDDLMLPGFPEEAVQDALVESAAGITGQVRAAAQQEQCI